MRFPSPSPSIQCLAAAATDAATMSSSRRPYRGRNPWRRGFSDRPKTFPSGDSQGGGEFPISSEFQSPPPYRQPSPLYQQPTPLPSGQQQPAQPYALPQPPYGQQLLPYGQQAPIYSEVPPPYGQRAPTYGQVQQRYVQPPPHYRQQPPRFGQPRPFYQPRAKPPDFRHWQYALSQPSSQCERFVVLSYNILADYLAMNHRHELYFHIPWHILDWGWRKRKIVFELGLWSPDIMCLQEVDRFQDLEEELKSHNYSGIWKMRTGIPVDGCAIFWRTTRFKLVHEECIEYNKLGLRDNVAQICVLESLSHGPADNASAASPSSSNGVNRVVVCNIHVLYNPRRGEIKLGQVRVLLERAHAVSKLWNDAPVIICGDFNCIPRSPLYNFILEQKLDLTGLTRDQISGQHLAELNKPKQYTPNYRGRNPDKSVGASMVVDDKEGSLTQSNGLTMHNHETTSSNLESGLSTSNSNYLEAANDLLDIFKACSDIGGQNRNNMLSNATKEEIQQGVVDSRRDQSISRGHVPSEPLNECSISHLEEGADHGNNVVQDITSPLTSCEDVSSLVVDSEHEDKSSHSTDQSDGILTTHSQFDEQTSTFGVATMEAESVHEGKEKGNLDFEESVTFEDEVFCTKSGNKKPENDLTPHSSPNLVSSTSFPNETNISFPKRSQSFSPQKIPTPSEQIVDSPSSDQQAYGVKASDPSTLVDLDVDHKLSDFTKTGEVTEDDVSSDQDHSSTISSFLRKTEEVFQQLSIDSEPVGGKSEKNDHSPEECATTSCDRQLSPPIDEVRGDSSPSIDSDFAEGEKTNNVLYSWTPIEIQTASGNEECTFLEHHLKLRSTYADVEDYSGTRDLGREPEVTSYHRRFMGTVDYIWSSEGLKTVKVLDTIPKHALQWTPGFPTPKWGSDHIALASQLAFTKDVDKS